MKLGFQNTLFEEIPEPHVGEQDLRVKSILYLAIIPNGNIGITYTGTKWRKIWNYLQVYKVKDVVRKSFSRSFAEKVRNDKWLIGGLGEANGNLVWFFHPSAQKYQSILSVPLKWTMPADLDDKKIRGWASLQEIKKNDQLINYFSKVLPEESGQTFIPDLGQLEKLKELILEQSFIPVEKAFPEKEFIHLEGSVKGNSGNSAVLFGFGNYARTITIPYLKPFIHIEKIHEIDPSLLINPKVSKISTNPNAEIDDYSFPVWLIAGFHHTHARLAIEAIKHGVIPVIEKPVATTWEDYNELYEVVRLKGIPFFQCYQKRYQIFNDFIFEDLRVKRGEPINFKATVFEIPLDPYHWYNWQSSGSRIISNGCHWIDHFLFINGYPDWTNLKVFKPNPEELTIQILLENGAFGLISLSDNGSNRIGMREYVEFTVPGRRAYIQDSMKYVSESNERIIRNYNTDKLSYLRKMYREIGQSIQQSGKGDDIITLKSTKLSLELEDLLKSQTSPI